MEFETGNFCFLNEIEIYFSFYPIILQEQENWKEASFYPLGFLGNKRSLNILPSSIAKITLFFKETLHFFISMMESKNLVFHLSTSFYLCFHEVLFSEVKQIFWQDKCLELLPQVQQQQMKSGKYTETVLPSGSQAEMLKSQEESPDPVSFLVPSSIDSSLVLHKARMDPSSEELAFETPQGSNLIPVSQEGTLADAVRGSKSHIKIGKSFKFNKISTPGTNHARVASPLNRVGKRSSTFLQNSHLRESSPNHISPDMEGNGFPNKLNRTSPLFPQKTMNPGSPLTMTRSSRQMLSNSTLLPHKNVTGKMVHPNTKGKPWDIDSSEDRMDVSPRSSLVCMFSIKLYQEEDCL